MIQVPINTTSIGQEITTPEFPADIKKKAKHTPLCSSSESARLCRSLATLSRV